MNICNICNSTNIVCELKKGRGLPPKGWVKKPGDFRRISWEGIWEIFTCNDCGNKIQKLKQD